MAAVEVYREVPFAGPSAQFFGVSRGARHVSLGVTFRQRLTLILLLTAFREPDFYFGTALFEVELERDDGE